jgi:hypothetical protein
MKVPGFAQTATLVRENGASEIAEEAAKEDSLGNPRAQALCPKYSPVKDLLSNKMPATYFISCANIF